MRTSTLGALCLPETPQTVAVRLSTKSLTLLPLECQDLQFQILGLLPPTPTPHCTGPQGTRPWVLSFFCLLLVGPF